MLDFSLSNDEDEGSNEGGNEEDEEKPQSSIQVHDSYDSSDDANK